MSQFCGSCGARRSSDDQRFCASCGATLSVWSAPEQTVPEVLAPVGAPTRIPAGRVLAVGAAVLALAGGGLVGWQVFGPQGGADSPEAAVEQFVTSIVEQDPVGAMSMMNPGEVEGVDDLYDTVHDRLQREGLVAEGSVVDAFEISVDDLELSVDELGDDAARVLLEGGDYTVAFDPDRLPERLDFLAEEYPDEREWSGSIMDRLEGEYTLMDEVLDAEHGNDRVEPFLATVRVDGRWYVSALGTFAEGVLADVAAYADDVPRPDYDVLAEEVEPIVGDDAEEVLENLAAAISDADGDDLLANLPAEQVVALRPYAAALEEAMREERLGFDVSVVDLEVETERQGDLLRVTVERAEVEAHVTDEYGGATGRLSVDGRCVTASEVAEDGYDDGYGDEECLRGRALDAGIDSISMMLREVDGGYQLDPLATAVLYARTVAEDGASSLLDEALAEICDEVGGEGCG